MVMKYYQSELFHFSDDNDEMQTVVKKSKIDNKQHQCISSYLSLQTLEYCMNKYISLVDFGTWTKFMPSANGIMSLLSCRMLFIAYLALFGTLARVSQAFVISN
ncbi:hypothetical protein T09_7553 [Trichinella sp. T9]|nr:hypothetical protein T09_7553 [Trichinella sp. T9]